MLVLERLLRLAASPANLLDELEALVDRLLPGEPRDKVIDDRLNLISRFRFRRQENLLDEIRNHHALPTLADQRKRAVEIEQGNANPSALNIRIRDFDRCAFNETIGGGRVDRITFQGSFLP